MNTLTTTQFRISRKRPDSEEWTNWNSDISTREGAERLRDRYSTAPGFEGTCSYRVEERTVTITTTDWEVSPDGR